METRLLCNPALDHLDIGQLLKNWYWDGPFWLDRPWWAQWMISRIVYSKLTVWVANSKKAHSKLTVWAHLVNSLWATWVSSKWATVSFNISLSELAEISNSSLSITYVIWVNKTWNLKLQLVMGEADCSTDTEYKQSPVHPKTKVLTSVFFGAWACHK